MRSLLQSELLHSVISSLFDFRRVDMCMASISLPNPHFCYGRAQPKYQFREERRKVFEQVCLLKAKNNISEEEENGYARLPLYLAVSNEGHCCRGRACDQNKERYTHDGSKKGQKQIQTGVTEIAHQ
ncbi:uncharacterized protein LOC111481959 isoform X2 [Cucurbita maxima]|uniref:Uncharacterized protein LOC111481959 isoform X2 n=1 Tax=Cucurbita maxima TaxID=3661 RepID=A0A6J1J5M8_CUCMA|nr:uncharacterized protein LOC111481959 isoform X2 [Cucurbita maxima]